MTADRRALRLQAAREYMRLPEDAEPMTVELFFNAAIAYLHAAGVCDPKAADDAAPADAYELAVYAICLHYYDHRDDMEADRSLPVSLQSLVTQLKLQGGGAVG